MLIKFNAVSTLQFFVVFFFKINVMFLYKPRVHNEVVPACDIVSQRMFRGGRTEYIRSPTKDILKFIGAFDDPSVSVGFERATNERTRCMGSVALKKCDIYRLAAGSEAGALPSCCGQSCISD